MSDQGLDFGAIDFDALNALVDDPMMLELFASPAPSASPTRAATPRASDSPRTPPTPRPAVTTPPGEIDLTSTTEARRPRVSDRLEDMWVDATDAPFTPQQRPGRPMASLAFAWIVRLSFVALLAWMIVPEVSYRFGHMGELRFEDGILTAQPVNLAPTKPAIVRELFVTETSQQTVIAQGTTVAKLEQTSPDGQSSEIVDLRVPFAARFVSIDTPVAGVALPTQPVITVYDPRKMNVIVTVRASDLTSLRVGMRVVMSNGRLPFEVKGTVDSAVPLLGTANEPTSARYVNIRITPDLDQVQNLVPGIRFSVKIDTRSVGKDAPYLVYTGG